MFIFSLELLISVHSSLVKSTLEPGQTMDGSMLNRIYKDKIVYVRPSVELRSQMVIFVYFSIETVDTKLMQKHDYLLYEERIYENHKDYILCNVLSFFYCFAAISGNKRACDLLYKKCIIHCHITFDVQLVSITTNK